MPEVGVSKNDASTFKPYNPNEIVGSTSPGLPYIPPASSNNCAVVAMVIVAVVATMFTAGAAAAGFGAGLQAIMSTGLSLVTGQFGVAAMAIYGGIGAFAGSIASQAVGKALGVVDKISLRQAFGSGLTAVISAGIGGKLGIVSDLINASSWGRVAASAALNSIGSYVANRVAGVPDTTFSWKSVAASAVTSVVAGGINKSLGTVYEKLNGINAIAGQTVGSMVSSTIGLGVRRQFGMNDKANWGAMAADAFGNAVGNAIVGSMISGGAKPTQDRRASPEQIADAERRLGKSYGEFSRAERFGIAFDLGPGNEDLKQSIVEAMLAAEQNGTLPEPTYASGSGMGNIPFMYKEGVIYVNESVLQLKDAGISGMEFLDASAILALEEEYGAHLDYLARNRYSSIGGDTSGDEGILYAHSGLAGMLSGGSVERNFSIAGKSYSFSAESSTIELAASAVFTAERVALDYGSNGYEYFDALGHYYTTAITMLDAGYSPEQTGRVAFYSQVGDIVAKLDATATATRLFGNAKSIGFGYTIGSMTGGNYEFTNSALLASLGITSRQELMAVQKDLHNLGVTGSEQIGIERLAARKVIAEGLAAGTLHGDAMAGFAIHKLADSYAHEGYPLGLGHARDMHAPDEFFGRTAVRNAYLNDLNGVLNASGQRITSFKSYVDGNSSLLKSDIFGVMRGSGIKSAIHPDSMPSVDWFRGKAWNSPQMNMLELSGDQREAFTGYRGISDSSSVVMSLFGAFSNRIQYWRGH